jgi:deoxyribodipyrimidine photo-lyase
MQKLEDEPRLEFENLQRACDGLRESEFREDLFHAWCEGQTGFPMVDACMRCVRATGWLNFRMRAMLASFSAYHLWLHWRRPAIFLARQFLDFEPGIHYSQFQMQSGTTGMNTLRIYSPAKQAVDQDPEGVFIRRWVPELLQVPTEYIAEPHRMPLMLQRMSGCEVGRDYPAPVVDPRAPVEEAKRRLYALRRREDARREAREIQTKHGSRRRPVRR